MTIVVVTAITRIMMLIAVKMAMGGIFSSTCVFFSYAPKVLAACSSWGLAIVLSVA